MRGRFLVSHPGREGDGLQNVVNGFTRCRVSAYNPAKRCYQGKTPKIGCWNIWGCESSEVRRWNLYNDAWAKLTVDTLDAGSDFVYKLKLVWRHHAFKQA
jgi:hypothetical protein